MLFPGLEGEDKSPAPLAVHRGSCNPPRHPANQVLPRGKEAQVGPAEADLVAEGLSFANDNVRAVIRRGLEDPQRDGIDAGHEEGACPVDQIGQSIYRLQAAEEVWMLDQDAGNLLIEMLFEDVQAHGPVRGGNFHKLQIPASQVGSHHLPVDGMDGSRRQNFPPPCCPASHDSRFRKGRRPIVHGGVGHIHARQQTDHRLVFVNSLEHALADLRLVGRVGGEKLRAAQNVADGPGNQVIIGAGAAKAHILIEIGVATAKFEEVGPDFPLRHRLRQVQLPLEPGLGRHILKKLLHRFQSKGIQHPLPVLIGNRGKTHLLYTSLASFILRLALGTHRR